MQMLVAAFDNQQVPILNACIEVDTLRAKLFLKEANQHVAFFRLKPSAGMVLQEIAFEANQVAAKGKVVFSKFHTDACCLERSSAFIDKVLVVAEDAGVGNLASGMEAVGNGLKQAVASVLCQPVEMRCVGILEQCLALQLVARPVGHAVAKNDEMLQKVKKLKCQTLKVKLF